MLNDKEAFKISVETQGIFQIRGVEPEMVERALSIICPTMLFPYARETIDSLMVKASLPPMMLAPMDFEAIYEESLRKKADEKAQKDNLTQGDSYKPKGGI
jgi:preprotein translocase subunit SecB